MVETQPHTTCVDGVLVNCAAYVKYLKYANYMVTYQSHLLVSCSSAAINSMPTNTCALADQPMQMRQILMCPYIKLTPWRRRRRLRRQPLPKVHFQYGHRCRICALLRCTRIPFHFICITRAYTQTKTHTRTAFGTSIRCGYLHSCNRKKTSEIDDPF